MQDFAYGVVVGKVLAQTVRLAFAMPVRAAGHQQIVPCGNRQQSFPLFRRIAAMPYFQAVQAVGDHRVKLLVGQQPAVALRIARMRGDHHTAPPPLTAAMTSCVDDDGVGM